MRPAHLAAVLVLAVAPLARAVVLTNDFGPGDTYDSTNCLNVSSFINVGVSFTLSGSATPTDIYVAMKSGGSSAVLLSICADASGHPGASLASVTITVNTADPQVYRGMLATPPALGAGTYWLKASPGLGPSTSNPTWMFNTQGQIGYSSTLPTGLWIANTSNATPALRVEDNSAPPLSGACCAGSICSVTSVTSCNALHTHFAGTGTTCNPPGNYTAPCCKADFNQRGTVTVQDLFDFLAAWFAMNAQADINGGGVTVQDLFDFLGAWFTGCP